MSDNIVIKYQYTAKDFARATGYIQLHNKTFRYIILAVAITPIIAVLAVLILNSGEKNEILKNPGLILPVIFGLISGLIWLGITKFNLNYGFRWFLARQIKSSPALQSEQTILFDQNGIHADSEFVSAETKWGAIIKATETAEDFYFFTSKRFAQFIPKNAFKNVEQQNLLKILVKKQLGEKAKF